MMIMMMIMMKSYQNLYLKVIHKHCERVLLSKIGSNISVCNEHITYLRDPLNAVERRYQKTMRKNMMNNHSTPTPRP